MDITAECPTCMGQVRETVGLVCQTCGTDYGSGARRDAPSFEEACSAVIDAWENAAPTQPCDDCLCSGVALWPFDDEDRLGRAIDLLATLIPSGDPKGTPAPPSGGL